jgi:hypothetical protein
VSVYGRQAEKFGSKYHGQGAGKSTDELPEIRI